MTQLPTGIRKGLKKPYIKVKENGIYSDYDETTGQGWDKVVTNPLKHGAHATSSVSLTCISNIKFTTFCQNIVTKNKSKSITAPKASKNFKKSDLPDGLNYKVLRCTIIPTVITYYTHQRDPWDQQPSTLCNEIHLIMKLTGGMDFEVDPKGAIYKNVSMVFVVTNIAIPPHPNPQVTQHLSDTWRSIIGSVSLTLITTFIFENQKSEFDSQVKVMAWAQNQLTNYCFLYQKVKGDDIKVRHNI